MGEEERRRIVFQKVLALPGGGDVAAALRHQLGGLESLAHTLSQARAVLPRARGDQVWRGHANRFYLAALESLTQELASAALRVDDAIDDTRRAISTMGDHVG